MDIKDVKKEFPNVKVEPLNDGSGCNIYLPGKLVLTIWFQKRKFYSNQLKVWRRFTDKTDLFTIIAILGNMKMKQTIPAPIEQPSDNAGTKQCIEHINRKIEVCIKNTPNNNAILNLLKTIKIEFEQYL